MQVLFAAVCVVRYIAPMTVEIFILIFLVVLVAMVGFLLFVLMGRKQDRGTDSRLRDLQETLDKRLGQNTDQMYKQMNEQAESTRKIVADITKELTEIKATQRETLSFTEQLQALENTLKNPQRRGALGEYMLENVIANVLPPNTYETQYCFKNNVRADAIVHLGDGKMIAIDAKFSLDNYSKIVNGEVEDTAQAEKQLREDIKKRIQETAKYILPNEGTLDYAFMFIPSEALYYDLLTQKVGVDKVQENMIEYAFRNHKVIIVSPTTLVAYLQTVQMGLKSLQIEKQTKEIITRIDALQKHIRKYTEFFAKVGKNLGTTVKSYNDAQTQFRQIDKDFLKISGKDNAFAENVLDAPHQDET